MLVRYTEEDITTGDVTIYAVAFDVLPIGTSSTVERPTISGGVSYLSLSLSGTAYSYNGSGELDPADQLIKAILTRYVSLGSCWAGASFPFATWFVYHDPLITGMGAFIGLLILYMHRGNI